MEVRSPTVGAKVVTLDQLKAEHEETLELVLQTNECQNWRLGGWAARIPKKR